MRGRALALALLPMAVAVVLLAGGATGQLPGPGWDGARWAVTGFAALVLLATAGFSLVVARARPAVSPTVPVPEVSAPDLYRLVRDLADRLGVPAPSAIALTPDCDSWLEDRTHRAHGPSAASRAHAAPVLVIGSPFLWWMRVAELRALLAPVVAGTGPSAQPDIAAARRFVRGLDAAVAVAAEPGRGPVLRGLLAGVGRLARSLLRGCREPAVEMERAVATAAAERAQVVDHALRIAAQEQVGLAFAGWDRLLTRVALPAWRVGRWPARLDAGVVSALTELSRRDRLAEGFASRLEERPACDLLEEPGAMDEAASLLAARLFHGGPASGPVSGPAADDPGAPADGGPGGPADGDPDWAPVDWHAYPEEVVDRTWRVDAARLDRVLSLRRPGGAAPGMPPPGPPGPATAAPGSPAGPAPAAPPAPDVPPAAPPDPPSGFGGASDATGPTLARVMAHLTRPVPRHDVQGPGAGAHAGGAPGESAVACAEEDEGPEPGELTDPAGAALAAGLRADIAREEAASARPAPPAAGQGPDSVLWDDGTLSLFPLQPPRTGRELLADHVTAMVCCAAVDTAGAAPGLDWLDGPALLVEGERAKDLAPLVLRLVDDGDPEPLTGWLKRAGVRADKPIRLV